MHAYIYETNILVDFLLNKDDRRREKKKLHKRNILDPSLKVTNLLDL